MLGATHKQWLSKQNTKIGCKCHETASIIVNNNFRYIALELCSATLQDYVEKKLNFECTIDAVEVLRQATMGLSHLHSMDIGELGIILSFRFGRAEHA